MKSKIAIKLKRAKMFCDKNQHGDRTFDLKRYLCECKSLLNNF